VSASSALVLKTRYHFGGLLRSLRSESGFKCAFILAFALAMEAGLWALFLDGFRFLDSLGGAGTVIINRIFALFYLSTGVLMVVSGAVTAYLTLFRSDEVPFLLTRPLRISQILGYKFMETGVLSSWAFYFIVIPFVGAYAQHAGHTPVFGVWTLVFSLPFLLLCSSTGTLLLMIVVRWFPRRRLVRIAGFGLLIASLIVVIASSFRLRDAAGQATFNLYSVVPGLRLAAHPLFPGRWVADGIMACAGGQWTRGALLWATLASTALMVTQSLEWFGKRVFFEAWQRVYGGSGDRNRQAVLLPWLHRALSRFPSDTRAILLKDLRVFLRDPPQWSQVLVFFGLLGVYFVNLRSFNYHVLPPSWRSMMIFLNVFSVSAVMCSLGARFIYPQLSLEGQALWILGLSPMTMRRMVMTKFMAAACSLVVISALLITISSVMLDTDPLTRLIGLVLVVAVSLAVGALSTGLGAVFLDLNQRNPAAIVSGFGGTLNLVLSLAFMLAAILPFGVVFHLRNTVQLPPGHFRTAVLATLGWVGLLTAMATALPLWIGIGTLRRRDF